MSQVKAHGLYDRASHKVSRRAFEDDELYKAEQRAVFGKSWLFLGHESQVPKPRDFFTTTMGEESVIVVRDAGGTVRAFLNSCRHRGMAVCQADRGNTPAFTCTYHAWTYDTSGRLIGVPKFRETYHGELDKKSLGLVPVSQVGSYKGLLFGTFDPSAPPLAEYLGDLTYYLDHWLDRHEGGIEVVGVQKWIMNTNWKVGADNNCGDNYHVYYTHSSIPELNRMRAQLLAGEPLQPEPDGDGSGPDSKTVRQAVTDSKHSVIFYKGKSADPSLEPAILEWASETRGEVLDRLGAPGRTCEARSGWCIQISDGSRIPTSVCRPSASTSRAAPTKRSFSRMSSSTPTLLRKQNERSDSGLSRRWDRLEHSRWTTGRTGLRLACRTAPA